MKKLAIATALITALGSLSSYAENPSFTYIEAGYAKSDAFDGFSFRGNYELSDTIFITGSYTSLSDDVTITVLTISNNQISDINITEDNDILTFGIGGKIDISGSTSVYAQAEYIDVEFESSSSTRSISSSEDGYRLAVGIRSNITASTELYSQLNHNDVVISSTDLVFGARQYFTQNIGVFGEYIRNDFDSEAFRLGASVKF